MALKKPNDMSTADWLSQTQVKNYRNFSHVVIPFFSAVEIPIKHSSLCNKRYYYTTQAVRGPITKINQSKWSIVGPIFSKYWTGHCPE